MAKPCARKSLRRREKTLTFGVVFPFSSHRHLLRRWLAAHGIDAERDVRIVVVPPPQMVANLLAGHLDGFCAGDPWNSTAVRSNAGWITATSSKLDSLHPEKVLMVGVPEKDLRHGLSGALDYGHGRRETVADFCVFHRHKANEPSGEKTAWTLEAIRNSGLCPQPSLINFNLGRNIFRPDIFTEAVRLRDSHSTPELYESEQQFALA